MIAARRPSFPGARPLVVGAARSGTAAARLLARRGQDVVLCDREAEGASVAVRAAAEALAGSGVTTRFGHEEPALLKGRDWVVWSPGIPVDHPLARAARAAGLPVLSELEVGWRATPAPFVCVTGTNGKSTTTDLIATLLREAGRDAVACGNIGRAVCEVADLVGPDAIVVAEVSSFQLETVDLLKPEVATWLNLTPDHLDRHGDIATYAAMKRRLFLRQDGRDVAVWNADDPEVLSRRIPAGLPAAPRSLLFSTEGRVARGAWIEDGTIWRGEEGAAERLMPLSALKLRGRHNRSNVVAAIASVSRYAPAPEALCAVLARYAGLEHRLEPVAVVEGVEFVNDSKATNVDSLSVALESFDRPVVLIAGGRDKGQDFRPLEPLALRKVARAILIGEGAQRIADDWPGVPKTHATSLESAVDAAFRAATDSQAGSPPSGVVLLSPGCASFDMFQDFEDRGRRFKAEVERLKTQGVAS